MAAETRVEKTYKKNQAISAGTGLVAAIAQHNIDKHISNVPMGKLKRLTRTGVVGAGVTGLGLLINQKFYNRAKKHERELIEQKGQMKKMSSNMYFDNTGMQEFIKTAAITMGDEAYTVPTKYAYNAYLVYNDLPEENKEAVTVALYNEVRPGMDKVAMKLVAANVYAEKNPEKIASLVDLAGKAAMHGMSALSVKSEAKSKLETANQQHKVPNPGFR